jgi:DMSO/TMAO reductase YedYZ molybdopterin-dependent catalytic subunit
MITRRAALLGGVTLGGTLLSGCDQLTRSPRFMDMLSSAEHLTQGAQRFLLSDAPLAREFSARDISPVFKPNGSIMPADPAYKAMLKTNFAGWRLKIGGLVEKPADFSLAALRALPARTQITRHDCVEGWSAIGQWTGVPMGLLLKSVGLKANARFVVLHCADELYGARYYESIDLIDAFHPQTILAYAMNAKPLEVAHGAPLRLRVERQLGYKHAKYVMRLEIVDSFAGIAGGKGGFWEDRYNYEWYAGI